MGDPPLPVNLQSRAHFQTYAETKPPHRYHSETSPTLSCPSAVSLTYTNTNTSGRSHQEKENMFGVFTVSRANPSWHSERSLTLSNRTFTESSLGSDTHTCTSSVVNCSMMSCMPVCVLWLQEKAISIWQSKDFFIELEPLPGGVEAVKEMARMDK